MSGNAIARYLEAPTCVSAEACESRQTTRQCRSYREFVDKNKQTRIHWNATQNVLERGIEIDNCCRSIASHVARHQYRRLATGRVSFAFPRSPKWLVTRYSLSCRTDFFGLANELSMPELTGWEAVELYLALRFLRVLHAAVFSGPPFTLAVCLRRPALRQRFLKSFRTTMELYRWLVSQKHRLAFGAPTMYRLYA